MTVLFTSQRPLERAENIKAVWDAYDGDKVFKHIYPHMDIAKYIPDLHSYSLQVTDELISDAAGKCLFIGHGMGAGKTYGLDQPRPYYNNPELITCAIASSESLVGHVSKQLGISESQVAPIGFPRTDAYFKRQHKKSGKKNYLYAPTFRNYGDWIPDFWELDKLLNDDETFIVKRHMFTRPLVEGSLRHIVEYGNDIPSTDFLLQADVLISDFSSIMFDGYIMRKPVVLFAKDRDEYQRTRGMYCTYPAMYSDCFCDNEEDMVQRLREAQWTPHMEELRDYHAGACDGHSVERCIKLIKDLL